MTDNDKYYELRWQEINDLSYSKKLEIAKDNDLLTEKLLTELIYDSKITLKEIEDWYSLPY